MANEQQAPYYIGEVYVRAGSFEVAHVRPVRKTKSSIERDSTVNTALWLPPKKNCSMAYLKLRSLAYEEISKNVPSPNTSTDFDTSLHITKSTR
jgi:hypothetical protein